MIRINIAAVVRWEKLRHRSFSTMDLENEDDVLTLLYCVSPEAHEKQVTYDLYAATLRNAPKVMRKEAQGLSSYHKYIAQFQQEAKHTTSDQEDEKPTFISDIAARLIITGGMDASYVMNEMAIEDIGIFAKAMGEHIRQDAESHRLWTYLTVYPHVSRETARGKMRSPQTFYPFPWEVEEKISKAPAEIEKLRASEAEFKAKMAKSNWKPMNNK